ncbi:MAG: carboxypeptidase regulatory-like domain-containing protein [Bryobacteraceae bacterium]|nr:carboxypeptidase regulatory-like domain-containing protein [Bryobacteraceae bacterium]
MLRLVLLLLFSFALSMAQSSSGSVTGQVKDASDAALPGVTLRLVHADTGVPYTATSNSVGEYTIPLLPAGKYAFTAESGGFQTYSRRELVVELGRTIRLDIAMQIGQVNERVEVTGTPPMLESETSSVGQLIENKMIADMPLNGRRVGDLLGLVGGAIRVSGDVLRPRMVISGGRADRQQWLLDGVNASNLALEIPQALFNPPVEAVQEIKVHQNAYSAELGNSSSGVVSVTTRSGTNRFTGMLYEYLRNDALDARNFFAASKPPLRWNVFGGVFGGPVIRNRTFFFTNLEFQRQRVGVTRIFTVPSELQRRGDFSQTFTAGGALIPIFDPATNRVDPANATRTIRTAFPGNVIPANRIDPVGMNIMQQFARSNRPATNVAGANNFQANTSNALNITTWTSRVDHIFREKDRVSVRYVLHDFPTANGVVFENPAADPNNNTADRRAHSLMLNHMHMFTPTLMNDLRFNYQPRYFISLSAGLDEGWPTKLGLRGVSDRAFPRVNVAGYASLGAGTQERLQDPIQDNHLVNSLSLFRGGHSLKFGGEYRLSRNAEYFNNQISGAFGFAVQGTSNPGVNNTGNAAASLLVGFPQSANIRFADYLDRRSSYYALFVQDDWKTTSNLTLNLGVRWEAHTPRVDANDRQNSMDLNARNPVSGTPGILTFASRDGVGRTVYNGDWNNFMPRVGFAWRPGGSQRIVIRGGAGIFFTIPNPGANSASAGFETAGDFTSADNGVTAPFLLRTGVPDLSTRPAIGPGYGAVPVGQAIRFAPEYYDANRRLGYSQQWNLSVQRDLRWNTMAEIAYVGNVGRKLDASNSSINQVRPELLAAGNAQIRRPYPQFGNVTLISPFWGNSAYHAMNLKVEKRFSDGLTFLVTYGFAKFMDDVTAANELGAVGGGIQNHYDRRSEWSRSGNDIRNRVAASSTYELPFGRGRKWMSRGVLATLAGGWNLGAIVTLQSGPPLGLVTQVNNTNSFNPGSQRVDVLRDPTLPKNERSVDRWFDTAAVAQPAQFTFGNSGRAILESPGLAVVNLSMLKNFVITERWNVQFRAEAFNALNRANFDDPGRALGAPTFGVINAASDPRNLQLGLKLQF